MNTTNIQYKIALLGNLEPLSFASMPTQGLVIKIYYNGTTFTYSVCPDINGKGSFDLQGVIKQLIETAKPDWTKLNIYRYYSLELPTFDITVKNGDSIVETHNLKVVDAGIKVDTLNDQARVDWLSRNFLTWQPTELKSKWHQPQYLSYVATKSGLKWVCKSYFADKAPVVEVLKPDSNTSTPSLAVNELSILNVQFHSLFENKEQKPYAFDIYVCDANNAKVSYTQRYVYDNVDEKYQDLFMYKNSLGGYDTLLMKGKKTEVNTAESELTGGKVIEEFNEQSERIIRKNTGYMTDLQVRTQLHEFILSKEKYYLSTENVFEAIVIKDGIECESNEHDLTQMTFSFLISRDTNYLNLSRIDLNENPLVVSAPDGSLLPVAPRLLDFPDASADSDPLILMQYKTEEGWRKMSYGALLASIGKNLNIDNANHTHPSSDIRDLPIKQIEGGTFTVIEAGSIERLKLSDDGFITSTAEEFELNSPNLDTSFIADKFKAGKGFYKNGTTDSHVLLGGGGHKAVSDFATSTHSHSYLPLSGGRLTGPLQFNARGWNSIGDGNGDNATYDAYNLFIKSHWGIGFKDNSDNVNGVYDTRAGKWENKGGYYKNGVSVSYEGHNHSLQSLSNIIVGGNEFNFVPSNYNERLWLNYQSIDRSNCSISEYVFGNGSTQTALVRANGFKKEGSSDNYVLLGGGGHTDITNLANRHGHTGYDFNARELNLFGEGIHFMRYGNDAGGWDGADIYLDNEGTTDRSKLIFKISDDNIDSFSFRIRCWEGNTYQPLNIIDTGINVNGDAHVSKWIYGKDALFSGSVQASGGVSAGTDVRGGSKCRIFSNETSGWLQMGDGDYKHACISAMYANTIDDLEIKANNSRFSGDVIAYYSPATLSSDAPSALMSNSESTEERDSPSALDILIEKVNRLEKQNEHLLNEINNLKNR